MWLALLGLGGLIVVGTFIHAFLQWRARFGEERRVVRIGEPAEATVIDRVEVEVAFEGSSKVGRRPIYHGSLVLEVRRTRRILVLCRRVMPLALLAPIVQVHRALAFERVRTDSITDAATWSSCACVRSG